MRRIAIFALVLFALFASACGDDDDSTVAAKPNDATDVTTDEELDAGLAAVEFFQSTEPECADHAESTGNDVAEPSLFAAALYDDELSATAGGTVVVDGAGTPLLVDADAGTITSIDGPDGAMPLPYSFGCPPDVYVGTIDDGGAATGDPCPPWADWFSTGDEADLTEMEAMLHDDPAAGEILDSLAYLLSDPPTESTEEQQQHEAAVDIIEAGLQEQYGCAPSRSRTGGGG